jgi:hypothetical protein
MPAVRRYMRSLRERQIHVAAMLRTKGWSRKHIAGVLYLEVTAVDDLLASYDQERALCRDLREVEPTHERKSGAARMTDVITPPTTTEGLPRV